VLGLFLRPTVSVLSVFTSLVIAVSFVVDSPPSIASPESIARSDVTIAIGAPASANTPMDAALAPGDTFRRIVDVALAGRVRSEMTLVMSVPPGRSSKLDTDRHGIRVGVDRCPAASGWTRADAKTTVTCSKPIVHILVPISVARAKGRVVRVAGVAPGQVAHLLLILILPSTAGNEFENQRSSIRFSVTSPS
jgi:hypothetical protein